jgi:hypothetical protein
MNLIVYNVIIKLIAKKKEADYELASRYLKRNYSIKIDKDAYISRVNNIKKYGVEKAYEFFRK